jgi:hypothetical protein
MLCGEAIWLVFDAKCKIFVLCVGSVLMAIGRGTYFVGFDLARYDGPCFVNQATKPSHRDSHSHGAVGSHAKSKRARGVPFNEYNCKYYRRPRTINYSIYIYCPSLNLSTTLILHSHNQKQKKRATSFGELN